MLNEIFTFYFKITLKRSLTKSHATRLKSYLHCFFFPDHADKFKEYLSSKHPNTNFSIEKQRDGCLSFLDVNIFRQKREVSNY